MLRCTIPATINIMSNENSLVEHAAKLNEVPLKWHLISRHFSLQT